MQKKVGSGGGGGVEIKLQNYLRLYTSMTVLPRCVHSICIFIGNTRGTLKSSSFSPKLESNYGSSLPSFPFPPPTTTQRSHPPFPIFLFKEFLKSSGNICIKALPFCPPPPLTPRHPPNSFPSKRRRG